MTEGQPWEFGGRGRGENLPPPDFGYILM